MDWGIGLAVFGTALGVSVASGLLGIGGGILMTPILLYLPPAIGLGSLDMRQVAGLTMVQGIFSAASGVLGHNRHGFVSRSLVAWMGSTIAASSFLGAAGSRYVESHTLQAVFAGLAVVAAALMTIPRKDGEEGVNGSAVRFNRGLAVAVAGAVGCLGGMVGQGGAFILVPLMLYVLRLPTRVALGSSLGIVFFSALAGFIGKLGTGQINLFWAALLVGGAIPGAQLGAHFSARVSASRLRHLLAIVIAAAAVKMGYEAFK